MTSDWEAKQQDLLESLVCTYEDLLDRLQDVQMWSIHWDAETKMACTRLEHFRFDNDYYNQQMEQQHCHLHYAFDDLNDPPLPGTLRQRKPSGWVSAYVEGAEESTSSHDTDEYVTCDTYTRLFFEDALRPKPLLYDWEKLLPNSFVPALDRHQLRRTLNERQPTNYGVLSIHSIGVLEANIEIARRTLRQERAHRECMAHIRARTLYGWWQVTDRYKRPQWIYMPNDIVYELCRSCKFTHVPYSAFVEAFHICYTCPENNDACLYDIEFTSTTDERQYIKSITRRELGILRRKYKNVLLTIPRHTFFGRVFLEKQ